MYFLLLPDKLLSPMNISADYNEWNLCSMLTFRLPWFILWKLSHPKCWRLPKNTRVKRLSWIYGQCISESQKKTVLFWFCSVHGKQQWFGLVHGSLLLSSGEFSSYCTNWSFLRASHIWDEFISPLYFLPWVSSPRLHCLYSSRSSHVRPSELAYGVLYV